MARWLQDRGPMNAPSLKVITMPSAPSSRPLLSHRGADRFTAYALACILIAAVMAFGAVEPWSVLALKSLSVLLAAAWLGSRIWDGRVSFVPNPLFLPAALLLSTALVQSVFGLTV